MTAEEFLTAGSKLLSSILTIDEAEVLKKITEGDNLDEFTTAYKAVRKNRYDEGHKAASGAFTKALRTEAKKLFETEIGEDLDKVGDILGAVKESYQPTIDPNTIPEKTIKSHTLYTKLEQDKIKLEKDLKHQKESEEGRLQSAIATYEIQNEAERALPDLKAVMPKHEGQKQSLIDAYRADFKNIRKETKDGVTTYWEGDKRLEDDVTGHPLTWEQIRKQRVEKFFELEGPERKSTEEPEGTEPGGSGNAVLSLQPKTKEALNKILLDPKISDADKNKANAAFEKATGATPIPVAPVTSTK